MGAYFDKQTQRWQYRFWRKGKLYRRRGFKTQPEAKRAESQKVAETYVLQE